MSTENRSTALTIDPTPAGMLTLGRVVYTVHAIVDFGEYQSMAAKAVAVVCGKRGAKYLLTDNGAKYLMTVWNISDSTKGWGGRAPMGNPWSRLGGFRDREVVLKMLGREEPVRHNTCQKIRCALVTKLDMDIRTGETTEKSSSWVTDKCGTPLFGDADAFKGLCRSCQKGWTHPNNYPADGPRPEKEGYAG